MARLGVFGGTFDPPHLAHLVLAAEAVDQLGLQKVLWVLTANPPHKAGQVTSPVQARLQLLQAALQDNALFELSRVDLDRPAPHYAIDTVKSLSQVYPQAELIYLMGGDSLRDLHAWHNPAGFVQACHGLGVMRRPGDLIDLDAIEQRLPGVTEKVHWIDAPLLQISASEIRRRVARGASYRYLVPEPVYRLIDELGLYR